jgi:uncharacterized protein
MRIAYATDLHGNMFLIEKFLKNAVEHKASVIIFGGDICPRCLMSLDSRIKAQRHFLESELIPHLKAFKAHNPDKVMFAMFGNDDYRINYDVFEKAEKDGLFTIAHNKITRCWDLFITGYSYVNTTPFSLKDWEKDDFARVKQEGLLTKARDDFEPIAEDLQKLKTRDMSRTILLTHVPPYRTNQDILHNKVHIGSKALREFIEKEQPLLNLCGHIHESPKMSHSISCHVGNTLCINPGSDPFNNHGNMVLLDIDEGVVKHVRELVL